VNLLSLICFVIRFWNSTEDSYWDFWEFLWKSFTELFKQFFGIPFERDSWGFLRIVLEILIAFSRGFFGFFGVLLRVLKGVLRGSFALGIYCRFSIESLSAFWKLLCASFGDSFTFFFRFFL